MRTRSIAAVPLVRLIGTWDGTGPAYQRLAAAIRLLVLDGRLALDVAVPGERDLASALGVSRTTVASAFGVLREEGWLRSRPGARSTTNLPDAAPAGPFGGPGLRSASDVLDLAHAALPAVEGGIHEAYTAALANLPAHLPGHGYEAVGVDVLREAIALRFTRRGLTTTRDQIVVTSGAQHAISLLLSTCCTPGDRVVLDDPTYPHAIDAVRHAGCAPVAVPLHPDDDGWDVDGWRAAMRQTAPRLAYLVADFQNPTGRLMRSDERAHVVRAAREQRVVLVVDETMVDLGLDARPPEPVACHADGGAEVVTVGSTGKTFWGGLRVGWIRASPTLAARLATARARNDLGTPVLEQLAVTHLLGDADRLLDARRATLRSWRGTLVRALAEHLPHWQVDVPPGGLALWATLPRPASTAIAAAAHRHGVLIAAGARFGVDGTFERRIRVPYTLPAAELEEAVRRLARADRSTAAGAPAATELPAVA